MNLFENIFGRADRKPVRVITDPRARERELVAAMQAIDLVGSGRMLADEKIRELNILGTIKYACEDLRYPDVIDRNIVELDRDLEFIITSLVKAVREGWEMTAALSRWISPSSSRSARASSLMPKGAWIWLLSSSSSSLSSPESRRIM